MSIEVCSNHYKTIEDIAIIKSDISHIKEKIDNEVDCMRRHVYEGEKEGGVRDQVRDVAKELITLKKDNESLHNMISRLIQNQWKRQIISGIVSGIVAVGITYGSSEIIKSIFNLLLKITN